MTFGSVFAGIGGFDLGLERAGMHCRWQIEIDPYCRKVLAKHWPDVKRYADIRTVGAELEPVELIAGGFPCQDISHAGEGAGLDGDRSGLWSEMLRIVRVVRPRYVLVENVSALLVRGLERILGGLAESGYDAEWQSLPVAAFGAPHIRDRVFVLAYASQPGLSASERAAVCGAWRRRKGRAVTKCSWWSVEPGVGRVAARIPQRVDRLKGLGNAVVPQVAEWIGRRILDADFATTAPASDGHSSADDSRTGLLREALAGTGGQGDRSADSDCANGT